MKIPKELMHAEFEEYYLGDDQLLARKSASSRRAGILSFFGVVLILAPVGIYGWMSYGPNPVYILFAAAGVYCLITVKQVFAWPIKSCLRIVNGRVIVGGVDIGHVSAVRVTTRNAFDEKKRKQWFGVVVDQERSKKDESEESKPVYAVVFISTDVEEARQVAKLVAKLIFRHLPEQGTWPPAPLSSDDPI